MTRRTICFIERNMLCISQDFYKEGDAEKKPLPETAKWEDVIPLFDGVSDVTEFCKAVYKAEDLFGYGHFPVAILSYSIGWTAEKWVVHNGKLVKATDEFTIDWCQYCHSEQVIYAKGITACPDCGKPLVPCSVCDQCDYDTCPYECTGENSDEDKEVTNPTISSELSVMLYKLL